MSECKDCGFSSGHDPLCRQAQEEVAALQSDLATARARISELESRIADAERGDPDGHLLAVYQVLRGSADVAGELFDGDDPHYERVVRAAKEMRDRVRELESRNAAEKAALDRVIQRLRSRIAGLEKKRERGKEKTNGD